MRFLSKSVIRIATLAVRSKKNSSKMSKTFYIVTPNPTHKKYSKPPVYRSRRYSNILKRTDLARSRKNFMISKGENAMKNDCLFCAIIDGEIPSYKIYDDGDFYVMLDRFPKCLGHVLILPKRHAEHIFSLNEKEAAGLFPLAQKIAASMKKTLDFPGLNLIQNNGPAAGQEVNHFHLHLIPRYDGDDMAVQYKSQDPSENEFDEMTEKLVKALDAEK